MKRLDKMLRDNLTVETPRVTSTSVSANDCDGMMALIEMLRCVADEMESGEWIEQKAAVLISRDERGCLTFCGWGEWSRLIEQAHQTRRTAA